jgi:hypothetical protein
LEDNSYINLSGNILMSEEGEKKEEVPVLGRVDRAFARISTYLTQQISRFVAFLFFLFTLGAVYGWWLCWRGVPNQELLIIAPAILGIIAYYNRTFAIVMFVAIILLFVIL